MNTGQGQRATVRRRLLGRRWRNGKRPVPVGLLLQLLAGPKVGDTLRRHVHPVAGLGVATPARSATAETEAAEAAQFDLLPLVRRLRDAAGQGVDDDLGALSS